MLPNDTTVDQQTLVFHEFKILISPGDWRHHWPSGAGSYNHTSKTLSRNRFLEDVLEFVARVFLSSVWFYV